LTKKCILATLFCLMLVSSFAAGGLVTVQASPEFPWDGTRVNIPIIIVNGTRDGQISTQ
jgi:hypothetical protein